MKSRWIFGCARAAVAAACAALCLNVCALASTNSPARAANDGFNDGIDRNDPDFVKASLLIFGPGEELFSCVGHVALRMECPAFDLDYCFSYEGERIAERLPKYFAGQLKMGLFAIPTEEIVSLCGAGGRSLTQYTLNLPPGVKQELWKILDDKAAEGVDLPYDYLARGCGKATWECLVAALKNNGVDYAYAGGNPYAALTPRERFGEELCVSHPWNLFILNAIVGTEVDVVEPVVLPRDVLYWAQNTKIAGQTIAAEAGEALVPAAAVSPPNGISPLHVVCLFLGLSILSFFVGSDVLNCFFLAVQSLLGLFMTYLVIAFWLPNSNWNWLIVPFNLLPLVFWRWRRHWALPFAGVLVLWELFMLLSPHRLTDPAYLVFVLAYVILYMKIAIKDGPVFLSFLKK